MSEVQKRKRQRRVPKCNPDQLRVDFANRDGKSDIQYQWGASCQKGDASLLHIVFSYLSFAPGRTLFDELKSRGYDISTFSFSIRKAVDDDEQEAGR